MYGQNDARRQVCNQQEEMWVRPLSAADFAIATEFGHAVSLRDCW
jgi:hypothetical protein